MYNTTINLSNKNVSIGNKNVITDWRKIKIVSPRDLQEKIKTSETAKKELQQKQKQKQKENNIINYKIVTTIG